MTHAPAPGPEALLTHAGFVRAVARAVLRGDADVDDAVQDTWLAVLEGGPKRPGPVRPWLATVVRRRAADVHRGRARRSRREAAAARPEATASTADLAARAELGRRMVDAVLALGEPYTSALLLRYYDDLPPRKVAERLEVPVETARTRVKRGLVKLREEFDREHDGDRRAWLTAFLPLLDAAPAAPVAAATGTGLLLKFAALLAIVVGVGVVVVWRASNDGEEDLPLESSQRDVAPAVLQGRGEEPETPVDRHPEARGLIDGRVQRDGRGVACVVELRALSSATAEPPVMWATRSGLYTDLLGRGRPLEITRSAEDGRFAFANVAPGAYEVRAIGDEGGLATVPVRMHGTRPGKAVSLVLPSGSVVLQGRAVYQDGSPFRGWIRVHAFPLASVTLTVFGAEHRDGQGLFAVDAEGRFRIRDIPEGTVRLAALLPGAVRYVSGPVTLPHDKLYTFVVDDGVEDVRGRIVAHDDGKPVAGAGIVASGMGTSGVRSYQATAADRDGRFSLAVPDRELSVVVTAPGYVTARRGADPSGPMEFHSYGHYVSVGGVATAPLERGEGAEILVRLATAPRVVGRVTEAETGRAVAGVTVRGIASDFPATGAWDEARTDEEGRYVLDGLPPGAVAVFAAGEGWVSEGLDFIPDARLHNAFVYDLESGQETSVDLRVVKAVRARGRVVDDTGAAVANTAVRVQPNGPFPPLPIGSPMWMETSVTDQAGQFSIETLIPGFEYRFYAEPPAGPLTGTEPIAVGGRGIDGVEIEVSRPRWLRVRVVDAGSSAAIAGARVSARVKDAIVTTQWWTDGEGAADIGPLPPGATNIVARAPGYLRDGTSVASKPTAGESVAEVEIRLARGGIIAGVVTGPPNVPIVLARVELRHTDRRKWRGRGTRSGRVDARGGFRFDGLPEGAYEFFAHFEHDGRHYGAETTAKSGDTGLEVAVMEADAEARTRWEIRVLDPAGRPVHAATARLHLRAVGGNTNSDYGDVRSGRTVLTANVDVEEAWLEIYGARDEAGVRIEAGALVREALPLRGGETEVRLPAPRAIAGVVRGTSGVGVGGVRIYAYPAGVSLHRWRPALYSHATTRTDADGRFTLRHLGEARYQLGLLAPPAYLKPPLQEVAAEATDVEIVLRPSARPVIEVRVAGGDVLEGARVVAHPPGRRRDPDPEAKTGTDGIARLPALVPDETYDLKVEPPDDREDLAVYEVESWTPRDLTVVLARAAVVSGRVVDPSGVAFTNVTLLWRREGGPWTVHRCKDDGTFRIPRLPVGQEVELYARTGFDGNTDPLPGRASKVRVGDEGVVLTAPRPVRVVVRVSGAAEDAAGIQAYLLPEGGHPMVVMNRQDGAFVFPVISPERTCTLYVVSEVDGRYALQRDVDPAGAEFNLELVEGLRIRGRLHLPAGSDYQYLHAVCGGLSASGTIADDGTFVVGGLFPGTWTLKAIARVEGEYRTKDVEVEAGQSVDITFD